jgi:hypothetical protein
MRKMKEEMKKKKTQLWPGATITLTHAICLMMKTMDEKKNPLNAHLYCT